MNTDAALDCLFNITENKGRMFCYQQSCTDVCYSLAEIYFHLFGKKWT